MRKGFARASPFMPGSPWRWAFSNSRSSAACAFFRPAHAPCFPRLFARTHKATPLRRTIHGQEIDLARGSAQRAGGFTKSFDFGSGSAGKVGGDYATRAQ